jgi:PAS domain S-box-containing protein
VALEAIPSETGDAGCCGCRTDGGLLDLLTRALEDSSAAIGITDARGVVEYVNPRLAEFTGYDRAELVGMHARQLRASAPTPPRPDWDALMGHSWRYIFHGRHKDGGEFLLSIAASPLRDPQGNVIYILSIATDLIHYGSSSSDAQAERPAPDMVLVASLDGTILFVDRTVPGVTREAAVGAKVFDFVPPSEGERLRRHMCEAVETRTGITYEIPSVGLHGMTAQYVVRVGPVEIDGRVVALSFISWAVQKDVSEQFAVHSESGPRAGAPLLTARELQVLALLARGLTNREAAERLQVSDRTIGHHVGHILGKLAVPNRTAAVVAAEKSGLVR